MRRAEIRHHNYIAGAYLVRYVQEAAWREDHRRVDNGRRVQGVMGLAMAAPVSVDWCGYWQRRSTPRAIVARLSSIRPTGPHFVKFA
jgi:hypothetical protein